MSKEKIKIIIIMAAIILLIVLICVLVMLVLQKNKLIADKNLLIDEIKQLNAQKDDLFNDKEFMKKVEYAQKRARELGLIKDGEQIWKLIE
ncbi:MAG: septum formation initiator family protein [Clostridia bacterium]